MTYLDATHDLYTDAANTPDIGLCCTTTPIWQLPDLEIPMIMQQMNYGCGSTINSRDLSNSPKVLYVGVGGGMELLQFAYFSRYKGAIVGIDVVEDMLKACEKNLVIAEESNDWFNADFVDLRKGDALNLQVEDESVDVAAQNCLFNIFKIDDLKIALAEMYRVLKPGGRLIMSDPITEDFMSNELREDDKLRALCLSGSLPLQEYIDLVTDAGFATIEIRAKRPYRILDTKHYNTEKNIFIESVEICAIKDPMASDGPCVFTGKTAIYFGDEDVFDDGKGHIMMPNQPIAICDKTAGQLGSLGKDDLFISESTYFYDGGGCC